jgi:polar amino acid transport system substrate-binding protein
VRTPRRLLLPLFAAFLLLLAACGDDEGTTPADPTVDDGGDTADEAADGDDLGLADPDVMRVGSDIDFAPFEFVEDGEYKGFDIDLMTEIGERLGVEVEFINTSFETIFTQLASDEFDAIISGITITEERQQSIDFSDPYFAANQALLVQSGSDIASVADLDGADVGVQAATTGAEYANNTFEGARVVEFPTSPAGISALTSGQIDAFFIDLPVAAEAEQGSDEVELIEEVDTDEQYGIGIQQGNDALREAVNEQLEAIIDDSTYEEIYSEWFEGDVPAQFQR